MLLLCNVGLMRRRYGLARYLLGAGAARTGDEMSGPALLLAGTATTGSGPLLLAALTASAALGGPVLGALLDRTPHPGRLLGGALATYATTLLLVRWTLGTLPFPAVLSLALTAGLFAPALAAGWTSRLPAITEHLPRAGALDAASYEFAALAGPALAGAVALTAGPDAALLTAVALIACALPAAWSLPGGGTGVSEEARSSGRGARGTGCGGAGGRRQRPGEGAERKAAGGAGVPPCGGMAEVSEPGGGMAGVSEPGGGMAGLPESRGSMVGVPKSGGGVTSVPGGPPAAMSGRAPVPGPREASGSAPDTRTGLLPDLRAGFRALLRIRPLARATLTSTLSHAGLGAFTAVTPFLGVQAFGAESAGAFLLAVLAFASLLASLALARRPGVLSPDALLLASTGLLGGAFLLAVVDPLAASVLAGLGAGPQLVAVFAIRHREAPERLRGQVFSTGASLKISGYAVGAGVAAVCPPGEALVAAAGFQALAAAGFLLLSRTGDRPKSAAGTCG